MLKKLLSQILFFFAFSFFTFSTWAASPDYDLASETGDVKGTITRCGQPVQNILIYAPDTPFKTRTNAHGNFKIGNFQQGNYELVVKKDGNKIGTIVQVNIIKKKTTDVGTHDFCNDLDVDSFNPPADCYDSNRNNKIGVTEACDEGRY